MLGEHGVRTACRDCWKSALVREIFVTLRVLMSPVLCADSDPLVQPRRGHQGSDFSLLHPKSGDRLDIKIGLDRFHSPGLLFRVRCSIASQTPQSPRALYAERSLVRAASITSKMEMGGLTVSFGASEHVCHS